MTTRSDLFKKYDVPAPRYTSYPTVPYWDANPTTQEWFESIEQGLNISNNKDSSWSMYIHVPFCESLCTFCGCNNSITKNHKLEMPYVQRLLKEFHLYLQNCPSLLIRPLKSIHLGGGSPTFLSAESLHSLIESILGEVKVNKNDFEGSIEVDPRRTTKDQLKVLRKLGFNRVSLGVQDFNSEIQRLIHRIQPFEITKSVTDDSRELGYESVNFDLIYGLPRQTLESVELMIEKTISLKPDRIALYSFALVPWIKPAQRLFKDEEVPQGEFKRKLYEKARDFLLKAGYLEIGMDHFALPTDALAQANVEGRMHRNFMGYTDQKTNVMVGLGVSSIGESPACFHQNEKILTKYEESLDHNKIPTFRGHKLTDEDQRYRQQILSLMCTGRTTLFNLAQHEDIKNYLEPLLLDKLVDLTEKELRILPEGKPFLRNACLVFDKRLRLKSPETRIFSQSL